MIKFLCKRDCEEFPETKKSKFYHGVYDVNNDIWLIDDWWIEQGINKENFELELHGGFVKDKNKKYFEVIQ